MNKCDDCGCEIPEDDGDRFVTLDKGEETEEDAVLCLDCRERRRS
jgi:hypothetical protein